MGKELQRQAGLFIIIAPFYLSELLPEKKIDFGIAFQFWSKTMLYMSFGILLSSVYILPFFFDFISMNVERVGRSYDWADKYLDSVVGTRGKSIHGSSR